MAAMMYNERTTVRSSDRGRHILLLTVAAIPLFMGTARSQGASAQAQENAVQPRNVSVRQSWSLDTQVTYSDNFRRLPEEFNRYNVFLRNNRLTSEAQEINIETPDNTILSTGLSGSALVTRPNFSGLISGSVRVGTYLNQDSLEDRIEASATPAPLTNASPTDTNLGGEPILYTTLGLPDAQNSYIAPNLVAAGTWQAVENLFYVDVSGLAEKSSFGRSSAFAASGAGQGNDEIIYGGLSVSPYIFRKLVSESSIEVRYRATAIEVLEERITRRNVQATLDEPEEDIQYENDSFSNEASFEYSSGDLLNRIAFQVGGFIRKVEEKGSDIIDEVDFTQASGSLDAEYALTRIISLIGTIGYDDISLNDIDDDLQSSDPLVVQSAQDRQIQEDALSGVYWDAGLKIQPSRRTSFSVSMGERYDGTSVNVDARYRPSERIRLFASASRQFDSGLQEFAGNAFQQQSRAFTTLTRLSDIQQSSSDALVDRALAFNGSYRNVQRGRVGFGASDRFTLGFAGDFRRTNFAASVTYNTNENDNNTNDLTTYNLSVARQATRRFSVDASARYAQNDGYLSALSLEGEDFLETYSSDEIYVGLGFDYTLGKRFSVTGQMSHSVSDNDDDGRGTRLEYTENAVSVGVRWKF